MASSITVAELQRLLDSAAPPQLIDVRRPQFHAAAPDEIAGAVWRDPADVARWCDALDPARETVVYCVHGLHVGRGVADELARRGRRARFLEGGIAAWTEAGLARVRKSVRGVHWITRERPRIDRIACPWLIARFIDAAPVFHFVPADSVMAEAERRAAIPFDVPGADLGHAGERCSFDAFLAVYGLAGEPAMARLAVIVRGADTGRPDLAPECAGLLALSHGLASNFADDHEMLGHGMIMYDALYSWCRAATRETRGRTGRP